MSNIISMDDLPFQLDEQESTALLNKIPENIASVGIQWGFNDTVFRDNLFEYIVKEVLHFESIDKYYESEIFVKYKETGECLSNNVLLGDVNRFKVSFGMIIYDKILEETPEHKGHFETVSADLEVAKKNAFSELAKLVFKQGYVVKKLEIFNIEKI